MTGKFCQLRICRLNKCKRAFLSKNTKKAFCRRKCENVYTTRNAVAKHKARERERTKQQALNNLLALGKIVRQSKFSKFQDLQADIALIEKIRMTLGQGWEKFKPVLEEMIGGFSWEAAVTKLPPRILTKIAGIKL